MSKQKEITGPGISTVLILGLLTFLLGGALGLASLISQEVPLLTRTPEPETIQPGEVYFLRGERIGRTAWRAKEDAWRAGMVDVLRLSEAELNQWSQERLDLSKPAPKGQPEDGDPDGSSSGFRENLAMQVTPVNFKIYEDRLQLATEVAFENLMEERTFIYQVTGHFESTPGGIRFVPEKGNLGAAPLGSVPLVRDWLYRTVVNRFDKDADLEWLEGALEEVESVEIADGQLVLRRRSES